MHVSQQTSPGSVAEPAVAIEIRDFRPGDAVAFRTLNEEWIEACFRLEDADREVLGDPEGAILRPGGRILMTVDGQRPVGCCALVAEGDGVYELVQMAVTPAYRARGLGRRLLQHATQVAHEVGARRLWLGSNRKLADALHLCESFGFRPCPPPHASPYARADVFMEMVL
jgi:putative acetyltransferase